MALTEYNGPQPGEYALQMVRGDTFQRKLFQVAEYVDDENPDLGTEPADVREYEFIFEIRENKFDSETETPALLTAPQSHITFGQSDEALQYDSDQGNPAGTTYDEVHIVIPADQTKISPGVWWWGVRIKHSITGVVELLIQDKMKVMADVPRFTEG